MPENWSNFIEQIQKDLDNRQINNALERFTQLINQRPFSNIDPVEWEKTCQIFFKIAQKKFHSDISKNADILLHSPNNPVLIFKLGQSLIQIDQLKLGSGFLKICTELSPDNKLFLREFISSLEQQGKFAMALEILEEKHAIVQEDIFLKYLYVFNMLIAGDLNHAKQLFTELENNKDKLNKIYYSRLECIIARKEFLNEAQNIDLSSLRSKYYILTGGILLSQSSNTGYYKEIWDTVENVQAKIKRLKVVLEILGLEFKNNLYPAEFGSEIIARTSSKLRSGNPKQWTYNSEEGLIHLYDGRTLIPEILQSMKFHQEGQSIYMNAAQFGKEQEFAPDILGYFYLNNTSLWGPGFTKEFDIIDRTQEPVEKIVKEIINSNTEGANDDFENLLNFVHHLKASSENARPSILIDKGQRERLWVIR